MAISETVVRQAASYRQGLVLGLTMAEVILLIVFAMLIALAAVWQAEHKERVRLQEQLGQLEAAALARQPAPEDAALMAKLEALLRSPERSIVEEAIDRIAAGDSISFLTPTEATYVAEIKS